MNKALTLNSSAIDDNFALLWVMNYRQSDASFFCLLIRTGLLLQYKANCFKCNSCNVLKLKSGMKSCRKLGLGNCSLESLNKLKQHQLHVGCNVQGGRHKMLIYNHFGLISTECTVFLAWITFGQSCLNFDFLARVYVTLLQMTLH